MPSAYLHLNTVANAAQSNPAWLKSLALPFAGLADHLPESLRSGEFLRQLNSTGQCKTVHDLLNKPLVIAEVWRRYGAVGEQQLATYVAQWLGSHAAPAMVVGSRFVGQWLARTERMIGGAGELAVALDDFIADARSLRNGCTEVRLLERAGFNPNDAVEMRWGLSALEVAGVVQACVHSASRHEGPLDRVGCRQSWPDTAVAISPTRQPLSHPASKALTARQEHARTTAHAVAVSRRPGQRAVAEAVLTRF